jgi:hypothetical protein
MSETEAKPTQDQVNEYLDALRQSAAICLSFLFCFISWIKVGTAFGLIVASCAIALFLASEIVGRLRVVEPDGKVLPGRRRPSREWRS